MGTWVCSNLASTGEPHPPASLDHFNHCCQQDNSNVVDQFRLIFFAMTECVTNKQLTRFRWWSGSLCGQSRPKFLKGIFSLRDIGRNSSSSLAALADVCDLLFRLLLYFVWWSYISKMFRSCLKSEKKLTWMQGSVDFKLGSIVTPENMWKGVTVCFDPHKMSHSFIKNCRWITLQVSRHQGRKTRVKNGR